MKTVADRHGLACCLSQQALVTSFSVVSTPMTLKDLNFQNKKFLLIFAIFGCSEHSKNECDEMAGDRLTVCEQELL